MLLNRQKPIARECSAWCPGGRSSEKPTRASPAISARTIAQAPPLACSAAWKEVPSTNVSTPTCPPPAAENRSMRSTSSAACTASSSARVAAGATRRSQPSQSIAASAASIASIRSGVSGCSPTCSRGSCSREEGCSNSCPVTLTSRPIRARWPIASWIPLKTPPSPAPRASLGAGTTSALSHCFAVGAAAVHTHHRRGPSGFDTEKPPIRRDSPGADVLNRTVTSQTPQIRTPNLRCHPRAATRRAAANNLSSSATCREHNQKSHGVTAVDRACVRRRGRSRR